MHWWCPVTMVASAVGWPVTAWFELRGVKVCGRLECVRDLQTSPSRRNKHDSLGVDGVMNTMEGRVLLLFGYACAGSLSLCLSKLVIVPHVYVPERTKVCTDPYREPDATNLRCQTAHLTNYSQNSGRVQRQFGFPGPSQGTLV